MNKKLLYYSESVASSTHLKDQKRNHHEDVLQNTFTSNF